MDTFHQRIQAVDYVRLLLTKTPRYTYLHRELGLGGTETKHSTKIQPYLPVFGFISLGREEQLPPSLPS